jgi:two-component system LytT family response regulator
LVVRRPSREQFAELKAATERQAFTRIAVPVGQSLTFIELDNILYLKAENSYTEINFRDKGKLLVSRTLKNFEDTLQDFPEFMRSHKSYIVNKKYIVNYVKSEGGYLELSDQSRIPINHEAAEQLMQKMTIVRR